MKQGRPEGILTREQARKDAELRRFWGEVISLGNGTATIKSRTGRFQNKRLVGSARVGQIVEAHYVDGNLVIYGNDAVASGGNGAGLVTFNNNISGGTSGGGMSGLSQVYGAIGDPVRVQIEQSFDLSPMGNPGTILFEEPHYTPGGQLPVLGMWNDGGVGASASLDSEVPFSGRPSIRLDLQGACTPGATDPDASPNIDGVVFKRRLQWIVKGTYSNEMWIRWTSPNQTNTFTTVSLYNRDGTYGYYGRIWLKNLTTGIELYYVNAGGTYTLIDTINLLTATHLYDPSTNRLDKAGQWTFVKLFVNFTAQEYIGLQVNQDWFDLTGIPIYIVAAGGAQAMHFSIEFNATTTTQPRYINVAQVIGRRYA